MDMNGTSYLNKDSPYKTPAFIKASDFSSDIKPYEIIKAIEDVVGKYHLDTLQIVKDIWRVYLLSTQAKDELVKNGIMLRGKVIDVHEYNPSIHTITSSTGVTVKLIRIMIKDLYMSVAASQVKHMLCDRYKLVLAGEIKYGYHRDADKHLSAHKNGDRFVFVTEDQLKEKPLPRVAYCGIFKCRLFHDNQFPHSKKECYKCFSTSHFGRNCKNDPACRICRNPGHTAGSPECEYYSENKGICPFGGYEDPCSNHHMGVFTYNDVDWKSLEHGWLYYKARDNGDMDLAQQIADAADAGKAKTLSYQIRCTHNWDDGVYARNLMYGLVKAKFSEGGDKEARDKMEYCHKNRLRLVEAVPSSHVRWGTGLSKNAVLHVREDMWPGENRLGDIRMQVMFEEFGAWDDASTDPEGLLLSEQSSGLTQEGLPATQALAKDMDTPESGEDPKDVDSSEFGEEPNEPAAFSLDEPDPLDNTDTQCKSDSLDHNGDTTRPIAATAKSTGGRLATPMPQRHRKGKSGTSRSRSPRKPSVKRENSSPTSSQEAKSFKSERKNSVNDKSGNASRSKGDSKIK